MESREDQKKSSRGNNKPDPDGGAGSQNIKHPAGNKAADDSRKSVADHTEERLTSPLFTGRGLFVNIPYRKHGEEGIRRTLEYLCTINKGNFKGKAEKTKLQEIKEGAGFNHTAGNEPGSEKGKGEH